MKKKNNKNLQENEIQKLKKLEQKFWDEYRETKEIFNKAKEILNKDN